MKSLVLTACVLFVSSSAAAAESSWTSEPAPVPTAPAPAEPVPAEPASAEPASAEPAPDAAASPGPTAAPVPAVAVAPAAAAPPLPRPTEAPAPTHASGPTTQAPCPHDGTENANRDDEREACTTAEQFHDHHEGLFARFTPGLGWGRVTGSLPPRPGFYPINELDHSAPVLALAGQLGAGGHDVALALELGYEAMLLGEHKPSDAAFHFFSIGAAGSYYFDSDFYLTAHLRWVGGVVWMRDVPCIWDCTDGTSGPGVGLTLGKEWFGGGKREEHETSDEPPAHREDSASNASTVDKPGAPDRRAHEHHYEERDDGGIGLALQANYAHLAGNPELTYTSLLVLLSLTHF